MEKVPFLQIFMEEIPKYFLAMSQKHDNELINRMLQVMENRKKKVTDLARETGIPKDRVYKWLQEGNNPKLEDAQKIEQWIVGHKMEEPPKQEREPEPSAMQILAVLAQAFADQAALMKSIESKMAQEKTQAKIADQTTKIQFSLQDVQGKVTTLWERQHLAIEEMREHFAKLGVHKIPASEDAHKKRDHNGGNS